VSEDDELWDSALENEGFSLIDAWVENTASTKRGYKNWVAEHGIPLRIGEMKAKIADFIAQTALHENRRIDFVFANYPNTTLWINIGFGNLKSPPLTQRYGIAGYYPHKPYSCSFNGGNESRNLSFYDMLKKAKNDGVSKACSLGAHRANVYLPRLTLEGIEGTEIFESVWIKIGELRGQLQQQRLSALKRTASAAASALACVLINV
jgi:hypothetical protein